LDAAISSDVIRGYIDVMILRVLYDGDSYGYEISRKITEISENRYSMKETTLYSAFSRLEKLGHLRPYPGTYSGGRERTYYTLTDSGRQYYRHKCAEWSLTKDVIAKFVLTVFPAEGGEYKQKHEGDYNNGRD
jgi:PadR family transcriptional regulator PadR